MGTFSVTQTVFVESFQAVSRRRSGSPSYSSRRLFLIAAIFRLGALGPLGGGDGRDRADYSQARAEARDAVTGGRARAWSVLSTAHLPIHSWARVWSRLVSSSPLESHQRAA